MCRVAVALCVLIAGVAYGEETVAQQRSQTPGIDEPNGGVGANQFDSRSKGGDRPFPRLKSLAPLDTGTARIEMFPGRDPATDSLGGSSSQKVGAPDPGSANETQDAKLVPGNDPATESIHETQGQKPGGGRKSPRPDLAIELVSYRPGRDLGRGTTTTPLPAVAYAVGVAYEGNHWCTGVLVDRKHVLTAGHCACGEPSTYRIVLKDRIPTVAGNDEFRLKGAPILFDHRSCPRHDEAVPGGDLALLPLDREINCDEDRVCRLGIPATIDALKELAPVGAKLLVAGYGWTLQGVAGRRYKEHVPIVSSYCIERAYNNFCNPFTEMVLADLQSSFDQRTDTCGGDSGGPVFLEIGGWPVLVAITSRATPWNAQGERGCGAGGVYELVGRKSVWAWLQANGVAIAGAADADQQLVSDDKSDTKTVAARAGTSRAHAVEAGTFNCADHVVTEPGVDPDHYCYPARGR